MESQLTPVFVAIYYIFLFGFHTFLSFVFAHTAEVTSGPRSIGPTIHVRSRLFQFLYQFPMFLPVRPWKRKNKEKRKCNKKKKQENFGLIGVIMYWFSYGLFLGSMALQVLPAMPCEPVEVPVLGKRTYRYDYIADSYNEKLPILLGTIFVLAQILFLLLWASIYMIKNNGRNAMRCRDWVFMAVVCLGFILFLIICVFLLIS